MPADSQIEIIKSRTTGYILISHLQNPEFFDKLIDIFIEKDMDFYVKYTGPFIFEIIIYYDEVKENIFEIIDTLERWGESPLSIHFYIKKYLSEHNEIFDVLLTVNSWKIIKDITKDITENKHFSFDKFSSLDIDKYLNSKFNFFSQT